jgi:hypothetical protein
VRSFFGSWNWRDAVPLIAYTFHFPPSEIWEMDAQEIDFWAGEAKMIAEAQRRQE